MEETTDKVVVELTQEELEELAQMRERKEREAQENKRKADRDTYRVMCEEMVDRYVPILQDLSNQIRDVKASVYRDFADIIELKSNLFNVKTGQRSHSWRNAANTKKITLGYHVRDAWNDTVDSGIEMVKQYISSLASSEETASLVSIILDLLAKDRQGALQAEKVLQLEKYAIESDSETFKEGVRVIKEAYLPEVTKQFIRVDIRDGQNAWRSIPLGITEVGNV